MAHGGFPRIVLVFLLLVLCWQCAVYVTECFSQTHMKVKCELASFSLEKPKKEIRGTREQPWERIKSPNVQVVQKNL